jgi:ligand-binding sensor domain-containing protein
MVRAILFLAFTLGIWPWVFSQDFFYSTRNYTAVDGLPQSQVRALAEDKSGYLWIGTEGGGLARFDGREFKVYTTLDGLLTNQVIGLRFDQKDNLWILHPRGITKFDGLKFKKFQAPVSHPSSKPIRRVYTVNDTLFLLSSTGLTSKIYDDSLYYWEKQVFRDKQVWAAHVAPAGEICFYLSDGSFTIRDKENYIPVTSNLEMGKLRNIFNFNDDVLLQSVNGLFKLNIANRKIEQLPWSLPHQVLLYDQHENKFWTTNGSTLFKDALVDGVVKSDTILNDVDINQVLIDSEGNTWFASNGTGLFKYFIEDFMRCSSDNMRGVMAILKDHDGASWVGTMNKGLWKIKKGKINSYVDVHDSYRNMIHCIREAPDGTIWVGTVKGLGKYDKAKDTFQWITREDGLPGYSVMNLEFDENSMWIGTGNGLCQYDGKSFKIYNIDNGLTANGTLATRYLKSNKTLYIGTELGINSIRDGKVASVSMPEIVNTAVYSINKYQDSLLLIGTAGTGVVLFDPVRNTRKLVTTRDGLASDFIYFVAADDKDYLWIGTEKGINRVKLDKNFDVVENLHYGYENGLTGVETNQNAFFLSPKTKYFGLVDGVYEFTDLNKQRFRSFDVHLTMFRSCTENIHHVTMRTVRLGSSKFPISHRSPQTKITLRSNSTG